ncbi:MAG: sigma-70 family RNA polymerase sigma factor [Bacilli bacterium]
MNKYEEVINSCSGLVYMIIRRYFRGYDIEDLYQVGVMGIIKAYNNYKENKNTKFSTYAYSYIYGEIYSYISKYTAVKVSKESVALRKKINEAKNILSQKLMKEPTISELANFLEISPSIISSIYNTFEVPESLDRIIYSNGKDITISDTIKDSRDYYNIDYMLLGDEINKLSEEEKKIIYLRYFEDKTQSEVAEALGINQVKVSRCEKKTLKRIRKQYQDIV